MDALASGIVIYAGYLAVLALVFAVLGRGRPPAIDLGLKLLEAVLVLQAVIDVLVVFTKHRPPSLVTHLSYLVVSIAVLPLLLSGSPPAVSGADQERSPATGWDTGLVTVACVATAVVVVRLRMTA